METHDILIGAVILIILSIQFAVFVVALKRINLFKKVIPHETSFRMVKVHIPESQIRSLSVNGILENESRYDEETTEDQGIDIEPDEEASLIDSVEVVDDLDEWDGNEDFEQEYDEEEMASDTEIWISKGNKERKITYRLLKFFEKGGWQKID